MTDLIAAREGELHRHLAAHPDDAGAWGQVYAVLFRSGRVAAAERALRRALVLAPERADSWLNRMVISNRLGTPEAAETAARRTLRLRPGDHNAYASLSHQLKARGALADAALLELDLKHPDCLNGPEQLLLMGDRLAENGNPAEARRCYAHALARAPFLHQGEPSRSGHIGRSWRPDPQGRPRILVTIAHYYQHRDIPGTDHGSLGHDPLPRAQALAEAIAGLTQSFGGGHLMLNVAGTGDTTGTGGGPAFLDIVVCTSQGRHALEHLAAPVGSWRHHSTDGPGYELGYECQTVLRDGLAAGYDWYCFLEDDIVIHDPLLLRKIAWFSAQAGSDAVLVPNRFEAAKPGQDAQVRKLYVDGDLKPHVTARLCALDDRPDLDFEMLGQRMRFVRPLNPHAGCYFLSHEQMAHWVAQPWFSERSRAFVGPLESAATLGILRAFRLYKPARANVDFLEVEHRHRKYFRAFARTLAS
ncbi:MAG: hypothetical protein K2Q10_13485 [Rhodospirillales bacterium]|nr:hypothetical protein [Rhodospirillales bacterium]